MLLEAIRKGANGGKVFSDGVNEYVCVSANGLARRKIPLCILDRERELDVCMKAGAGAFCNKQIASVLNIISEQTVKVHIRNLLRNQRMRSRVAATILFYKHAECKHAVPDGATPPGRQGLISPAPAGYCAYHARRASPAGSNFSIISPAATASPALLLKGAERIQA